MPATANEKKGIKIGGVVHREITEETAKTHAVITCDANNWGMRKSNMVPKNGQDNWEYPVVKEYVKGIKPALEKFPWAEMTWPFDLEQKKKIAAILKIHLHKAWADTAFGIPEAAFAAITFPDEKKDAVTDPNQHGAFSPGDWDICLGKFDFDLLLDKRNHVNALILASTLFHEGRHTQQYYWMFASVFAYPEDYADYVHINTLFTTSKRKQVLEVVQSQKIPDEPFAKVSIKRMTLSQYYRNLCFFIDNNYQTHLIGKEDDPNSEVYKVRTELERLYQNVPIQKIGHDRDGGYRIRPTEEDSFALEKIVEHYWYGRDSGIPAPTACTNAYSQQIIRAKK
ncbi:hypothetical protein CAter10_0996 [Collimonas arenae]|nr:hypothetical protein CAter10_0996 [Collimonas arenae]